MKSARVPRYNGDDFYIKFLLIICVCVFKNKYEMIFLFVSSLLRASSLSLFLLRDDYETCSLLMDGDDAPVIIDTHTTYREREK